MKILEFDLKTKKMGYREMSPEEIAEQEKSAEQEKGMIPQPTAEERIEALEMALIELAEVMTNG